MKVDLLALCDDVGLDIGHLVGERKTQAIVLRRNAIYYRLRNQYGLSLTEIGDLCHKDHTAIMYGLAKYRELRDLITLTEALVE